MTRLIEKTLSGFKWSALSTVLNLVSQLVFMAIMARLLDPAAFGLVAIAMVVLRFASYFAQMGVGPAVVQKKVLEEVDIRVAFTLSVSLGCIAAGVIYMLAPLIGPLMENDQLAGVIRVLTISFLLTGLSTVPIYLLRRGLRFKALAFVETVSYILGYGACGVLLALNGAGVWSLVGASLSQGSLTFLLGYYFARHPILPAINRQSTRHFFNFGSRYSIIGFLEFVGSNLDTMIIGRVLGDTATGLYNRAFLLTNLPIQYIVNSVSKVMFPVLSEVQNEREKIGQVYLVFLFLIGSLTGAVCFGMIPAASDLVLTLLGKQWEASVPVLQVLAVAVPFVFLSHISGIILDALANLRMKIMIQSASIVVLITAMFYLSKFGLIGFAGAVVIAELFKSVVYFLAMNSLFKLSYRDLLKIALYTTAIPVLTMTAIWLTVNSIAMSGLPHWGRLAVEVLVGAVSVSVLFMVAWSGLRQLQIFHTLNIRFPLLLRISTNFRLL